MSTSLALTISAFLLAANAFFVGAEFALISARRAAIEPKAAAGGRAAKATLAAMEDVSLMMAGAQLGITICSLGLGYLGEPAIAHALEGPFHALGIPDDALHPIAFAIALSIIGFLHVVLGEMVPKNLALAGPDRSALVLAPALALVVRILRPVIALLNWFANVTLRLVGVTPKDEVASAFTRDEVAALVDESHREGLIDDREEQLLLGALDFEERDARAVLLPLDRLEVVDPDVTPHALEDRAGQTGYSRFPVVRDGELVGYLHLKDVLEFDSAQRRRPIPPERIRRLAVVGEHDRLRVILATMQREQAHMAIVKADGVDGPDGVLGVVTLEDVLEELVGEVRDEATAAVRRRRAGAPS